MAILFDQFGREIQIQKQPDNREIAVTTVRDRWSDYPSSGLTPQRLATIFKEADMGDVRRQSELFEEMEEKDTHLFSELQTRKNAVHGLDYEVAPWDESAESKKIRDFVADCLFNLENFDDSMLDLLDAIGKGFSLCEILWDVTGNQAVIGGLTWIHPKKTVFYERGAANMWAKSTECPRILTEAEPFNGEIMPPFKLVYHRYKARSGYDTRAGVLRVCGWMYLFKNYGIKDWVAFAEVFGMPLRLGKYDSNASKEDRAALIAAIQSLGSDAAGIVSKNTEIEFIETVKNSGTNNIYETLANFCDKQTSKAILGQTATTEGTPGKLGNEDAQDRVRHDLTKADAESLSKTIRYQIIRPLVGYNFGWDKPLPWFNILYQRPEDLAQLMTVYKGASELGQPISQEHVSERFKIPLPKAGETTLSPKQVQSGLNFGGIPAKNRVRSDDDHLGRVIIASDAYRPNLGADDWRAVYLKRLKPALQDSRSGALDEIEAYLNKQSALPTEEEFTAALEKILNISLGSVAAASVDTTIADIYKTFRGPTALVGFGGPDVRATNFLSKLDNFYVSKWIQNPDAVSAVKEFLSERYLQDGAGLFGRQNPENIQAFRDLFEQKLADLEDWQVGRIIDTSVTRIQNWAAVDQYHEAGITEIEVYEPTQECEFCRDMNGRVISVETAYKTMQYQSGLTPEQYSAAMASIAPTMENADSLVAKGALPPYHPHCRGIVIKRVIGGAG
jgi:phage gp29-like protein